MTCSVSGDVPSQRIGHETGLAAKAKLRIALASLGLACVAFTTLAEKARAQDDEPLQPGEAYVTRFSGTAEESDGLVVIDVNGTVGSIVDVRNPSQPPQGQHWLNEPRRHPVSAGETGQVFGVAIDDQELPSIYLTATSAFGLHRTTDGSDWMKGMWGPGGGPGTVWKIDPAAGYKPVIFAHIGVDGRANTGAALGNIAYDKWHDQLYVSDLETGLIHRLQLDDGTDLGQFDHGTIGRGSFLDVATSEQKSLPGVPFDPASKARVSDCPGGLFTRTPSCWNFADFRRRVWGIGVRKDADSGEVRLYYAIWGSKGFGAADFASADDDEKHNSVWSVGITSEGDFDRSSVRKEFVLPDFFTKPADVARFGFSRPVADIAFCECEDQKIMLVSERGGTRNLGLEAEDSFAYPHQSRVLRYELDKQGKWEPHGRYDVGFYDRKNDGQPFIRANSSGGVDFGYGYGTDWNIDTSRPDQTAWMTGGTLCSPHGPCFSPDIGRREDGSHVAGGQGTPVDAFTEVLPPAATKPYPAAGVPYPATGPLQSFIFDADINLDADNNVIMAELERNDATKVGDIEIYETCVEKTEDEPELVEEEPPEIEEPPVVDETPEGEDPPDLEKVKTGPAQCIEGGICTFSITITNLGPGIWSGPLWEIDTLPPGAILWDYRPQPDWLCTQASGSDIVNCVHDWVTLNPGDLVSLEIDVLLPFGVTGLVDNCIQDVWLPSWDPNDPGVILAIEQALNAFGYPVGPIDGVLDVVTMNSIRVLQFDNGLPVTGIPDQALIDLLFGGSAGLFGDGNPANDMDCHTVEVIPAPPPVAPVAAPDLQVRKIQRTAQCRPDGLCDFEVWFMNRGPGDWTGVPEFTDTLPQGATFVAATAPAICNQAGRTLACRYPRQITLPPNSRRQIVITIRMPRNLRPGTQNCASIPIGISLNDPDTGNNRQCIPIRVAPPPEPDIQTLKFQTADECTPGEDCTFDLWFINRGPGTWRGRPQLSDTLPPNVTLKDHSTPWTCRQSGSELSCTHDMVTLRPWRGVKVSVTVTLPNDIAQDARNCVRVGRDVASRRDPVPQNNERCITIRLSSPPETTEPPEEELEPVEPHEPEPTEPSAPPPAEPSDTRAEKTQMGPCKPGKSCLFELKFINQGPAVWTGKPKLSDLLPDADVKLGTWSPSAWDCNQEGSAITCEHSGATIARDEHVSLTMTLKLPEHLQPGAQNCMVIEHPEIGPVDPHQINDRHCVTIDVVTPGFKPRPPAVVEPSRPCPRGTVKKDGECLTVTHSCPKGYVLKGKKCYSTRLTCPKGYKLRGKKCYSTKRTCPKGYVLRGKRCYSTRRTCPKGYVLRGKRCYPRVTRRCPPGYLRIGSVCIRIKKPPGRRHPPRRRHHD